MYPSRAIQNAFGEGLAATAGLPPGRVVAKFEGPIMRFRDVPEREVCHALLLQGDDWLVACSSARLLNHSCDPNCVVLDSLEVATLREVREGEELTICYNAVELEEFLREGERLFWDERWSFKCQCGSPQCAGVIDGYAVKDPARPDAPSEAMAPR